VKAATPVELGGVNHRIFALNEEEEENHLI